MSSRTRGTAGERTFSAGRLNRVEEEGDGELVMMVTMVTRRRNHGGGGGAHVCRGVVRSIETWLFEHVAVDGEPLC
jgi:hypothetical protein